MKIIFTKSNIIGSKIIRWVTQESVSHVAFLFDNKVVIHSSLFGVDIKWFKSYKEHNDVVFEINVPLELEKEERIWQSILDKWDSIPYDYFTILKFGWSLVLRRLRINHDFKDANPYADMCVELYDKIQLEVPALPKIIHLHKKTPGQLHDILVSYK